MAENSYSNGFPMAMVAAAEPLVQWLWKQVLSALAEQPKQRFVIAISGAQGTGKSTLAQYLAHRFRDRGVTSDCVSLDDFYLAKAKRVELAAQIHPKLAQRGVPGTHDRVRAEKLFFTFKAGQTELMLPTFDKATDQPGAERPMLADCRVLFFEGWCVGLPVEPQLRINTLCSAWEASHDKQATFRRYVNEQLDLYQLWFTAADWLIGLQAPDWPSICQFRAKQELQLGERAMSEKALTEFMQPFYRLTRWSLLQLPSRADWLVRLNSEQQWLDSQLNAEKGQPLLLR